jgi:hypothetical protein
VIGLLMGLCVFVGILVGCLVPALRSITFDQTINPGQVLNAIATLAVAILINFLYASSVSRKKLETDLLIDHVKATQAALSLLQREALACQVSKKLSKDEQHRLNAAERELSNSVHSLEMALRHCKCKLHKVQFDLLKDARAILKESLTDTPFPGPYDPASLSKINSSVKVVRDELTRLIFTIHRR